MTRRLCTALAALAALAPLAGCGEDKKTIPHDDGATLIRLLRDARDQAGDPDKCPQLQLTVQRVQGQVASLPSSVDKDTRDSLVNGVNNLIDDARSECENAQTTTETTPTETTPTAPPQTQETTPPTTETTPPPTTPTAPPQTTPAPPGNGGVTPGNTPQVPQPKGGKKGPKGKKDPKGEKEPKK
jgi:hypothetical protein